MLLIIPLVVNCREKDDLDFRVDKLWDWYNSQEDCNCNSANVMKRLKNLELNFEKLSDKISQIELGIGALTRQQVHEMRLAVSTKTEPTTTTTTTSPYPTVDCGGNGFYQVGRSCFSFTFY